MKKPQHSSVSIPNGEAVVSCLPHASEWGTSNRFEVCVHTNVALKRFLSASRTADLFSLLFRHSENLQKSIPLLLYLWYKEVGANNSSFVIYEVFSSS